MDEISVRADDGVRLHVAVHGEGPDVVVLSGGPGCVQYLEDEELCPSGFRCWLPEPRGVGRSEGGPHEMARALVDLEDVRRCAGVERWLVVGHSWGSDLAVRYALDHHESVRGVVGVAGHGLHKDRSWSEVYEAARATEAGPEIDMNAEVWTSLQASFLDWIHQPELFRSLAETEVPMVFLGAELDSRPDWPLRQLAALVPRGRFASIAGVPHDFWSSHPEDWATVLTQACASLD